MGEGEVVIHAKYFTIGAMRYLGIDYGTKKIGLALSDEGGTMGFPHEIIPNSPKVTDTLLSLIAKENIGGVVMGESLNYKGEENAVAKKARVLGEELHTRGGVPVFYEPEVLTTAEARRKPGEIEKSRA